MPTYLAPTLAVVLTIASIASGMFDFEYFTYKRQSISAIQFKSLPDPKEVAKMARFIVHHSNWTGISHVSRSKATYGWPMADLLAVSDGAGEHGTGVPYFYVSRLMHSVKDLMDNDNRCSLVMSLAQSDICKEKHWDPEDPRCAHVVLSGRFFKVDNRSAEYDIAKTAVFSRHPTFVDLPESHHFFFAKMSIERVLVQDTFGGPSVVPVSEYFASEIRAMSRTAQFSKNSSNSVKIYNILLGFSLALFSAVTFIINVTPVKL